MGEENLDEKIKVVKEKIKADHAIWKKHPFKEDIDKLISNLVDHKFKNEHERYSMISQLRKKVLIVDTFRLERLLEKSKNSGKLIKGKDIILVMGDTGGGKSTTILKFLGNNFKKIVL